jgi:hypothetical protein
MELKGRRSLTVSVEKKPDYLLVLLIAKGCASQGASQKGPIMNCPATPACQFDLIQEIKTARLR